MPTARLRIASAQTNPVVGDISGNSELIQKAITSAHSIGAHVLLFPEMAMTGYPVEDLALRPAFRSASIAAVSKIATWANEAGAGEILIVLGYLDQGPEPQNAVALIHRGKVVSKYIKRHLPNYGVFDEFRNFTPGAGTLVVRHCGVDIGIAICEDIWQDSGVVPELAARKPGVVLVANASPYERKKDDRRLELVQRRAKEFGAPVIYVNQTGAQDDLVFDGDSIVVDAHGKVLARAPQFQNAFFATDLELAPGSSSPDVDLGTEAVSSPSQIPAMLADRLSDEEEIWSALVMGLGDYVKKNGFRSVALGLSGGIDSALVATIAVDALGKANVVGVSLPSKYSSDHSLTDAKALATNLGIDYRVIEIEPVVQSYLAATTLTGVAEENVQARVRGSLLMGLSNQEGHLILATGNKSELAVGYSTLYGDAVGGFAPIKDIFKVDVWRLARWRNQLALSRGEVAPIPLNSIDKEPSAELRPGQKDSDSLPPYELLDQLLDIYVEKNGDAVEIIKAGFDKALVDRVITMVDRAEYKRRQYPPGTKVSAIAFGKDRRLPMTSRWKES
jgi:NAD+ synthase (glutamine-hydrolysing)